jgi:hypothetical protein
MSHGCTFPNNNNAVGLMSRTCTRIVHLYQNRNFNFNFKERRAFILQSSDSDFDPDPDLWSPSFGLS